MINRLKELSEHERKLFKRGYKQGYQKGYRVGKHKGIELAIKGEFRKEK